VGGCERKEEDASRRGKESKGRDNHCVTSQVKVGTGKLDRWPSPHTPTTPAVPSQLKTTKIKINIARAHTLTGSRNTARTRACAPTSDDHVLLCAATWGVRVVPDGQGHKPAVKPRQAPGCKCIWLLVVRDIAQRTSRVLVGRLSEQRTSDRKSNSGTETRSARGRCAEDDMAMTLESNKRLRAAHQSQTKLVVVSCSRMAAPLSPP
jgi:hypothetical protein